MNSFLDFSITYLHIYVLVLKTKLFLLALRQEKINKKTQNHVCGICIYIYMIMMVDLESGQNGRKILEYNE